MCFLFVSNIHQMRMNYQIMPCIVLFVEKNDPDVHYKGQVINNKSITCLRKSSWWYVYCHVMSLSVTAYPFPWGRGMLLLEPIPALSQGEGRVLPGQVDMFITSQLIRLCTKTCFSSRSQEDMLTLHVTCRALAIIFIAFFDCLLPSVARWS